MTLDEYILQVVGFRPNTTDDQIGSLQMCYRNEERLQSLRDNLECFGFDPEDGYEGLYFIKPLSEVKAVLSSAKPKVFNWLYDRQTRIVSFNLNAGVHQHMMAALYNIYNPGNEHLRDWERADKFVERGYGFFRSSASFGRAIKGGGVKLDAQERAVFKDVFSNI